MLVSTVEKFLFVLIIFFSLKISAKDLDMEISGSVHSGYKIYDHYSFPPYFDQDKTQEIFSVARIIFEGDINNQYSYELHAVQAYDYSNVQTGVGGRSTSMLLFDLSDNWINDNDRSAHSYIDRASIKFFLQDVDIQVGRLATSFGKPTFWNLFDYYGNPYLGQEYKVGIFMVGLYGFTFSILATALFQGVMFTYAILKNEILGIDQRLRSVFSNAVFAAIGGILLLITSETMESLLGFGWIGSIIIGVPMIILRRPILTILNRMSGALMPESLTKNDKTYLDAYELAIADGIITEKERGMLSFQPKTLRLNDDWLKFLESHFDDKIKT